MVKLWKMLQSLRRGLSENRRCWLFFISSTEKKERWPSLNHLLHFLLKFLWNMDNCEQCIYDGCWRFNDQILMTVILKIFIFIYTTISEKLTDCVFFFHFGFYCRPKKRPPNVRCTVFCWMNHQPPTSGKFLAFSFCFHSHCRAVDSIAS